MSENPSTFFVVTLLDKIDIKIETKTKLENLPKKYRDQLELLRVKKNELFGIEAEANELESDKPKGQLKK